MTQLQTDEVTTIIPFGMAASIGQLMEAADRNLYEPEWLLAGAGDSSTYHELDWQAAPPRQLAHLVRFWATNKNVAPPDRASNWAHDEQGLRTDPRLRESEDNYHALLVLASGIQAAGPNLTPETFARGLQSLKFPNPGAGAAPYYQASVGFAGDHVMVDDEALAWWSPTAPADYLNASPAGGWCYVDRGARWRSGTWPRRQWPFGDPTQRCR